MLQAGLLIFEHTNSPWAYNESVIVPIWGPSEGDPLLLLSAPVLWGVISAVQRDDMTLTAVEVSSPPLPPLLQLPLKIRSSNFAYAIVTPYKLLDVEYMLQNAAFNPIGIGVMEKREEAITIAITIILDHTNPSSWHLPSLIWMIHL